MAGKKVTVAVVKLQWDLHQVLPVVQHSLVCSVRLSRIRHNSVHHSSKHSSIRYNDVQHSTAASTAQQQAMNSSKTSWGASGHRRAECTVFGEKAQS